MKYYKNKKTEKYANKFEKDFSQLEAKNATKTSFGTGKLIRLKLFRLIRRKLISGKKTTSMVGSI